MSAEILPVSKEDHQSKDRTIPRVRIRLAHPSVGKEEIEAVTKVLAGGRLVQGAVVEGFEQDLAGYIGAKHVIVVSSGTAALHLALVGMKTSPNDIIYMPSFAWPSAANMVVRTGAIPFFVDVDPGTGNIDPDSLRARIDESVDRKYGCPRAIVAVHEFGLPCDMTRITEIAREYRLCVIEDAACALGAKQNGSHVGMVGEVGVFSFHPRKSITTGEGGAIVTANDSLAATLRALRNHGQIQGERYRFESCGFNYRMTEMQAAIGRTQLARLDSILAARKRVAGMYLEALRDVVGLTPPQWRDEHTWQTFMTVFDEAAAGKTVIGFMRERGIEAGTACMAAHRLSMFTSLPGASELPVSSMLAKRGVALPMHDRMTDDDVREVANTLRHALKSNL